MCGKTSRKAWRWPLPYRQGSGRVAKYSEDAGFQIYGSKLARDCAHEGDVIGVEPNGSEDEQRGTAQSNARFESENPRKMHLDFLRASEAIRSFPYRPPAQLATYTRTAQSFHGASSALKRLSRYRPPV
jgi:hypothetical protein